MTPAELIALAERCEAAEGPEQEELLLLASDMVRGPKPPVWGNARRERWTPEYTAWTEFAWRFQAMLEAEAYESAALMLVPVGCEWSVNWAGNSVAQLSWLPDGPAFAGYASTPALAIAAASLRARAGERE